MSIKLIVLDVDGVLTDGKLFIGSDGTEYKAFNTQDGMGISLARYAGIKIAIITGRVSSAVSKRAKELNIDYVYQGINHKIEVLEKIAEDMKINFSEICYIGDDINDLPILKVVGYPACPLNAVSIVKQYVEKVSMYNGGDGAVREIIDEVLSQQYDFYSLVESYLDGKQLIKQ
ncbi:KdsC family phosphatase [Cytobacillus kochii]|uniref:3-deoxy-D-manno-octulosonate 8-phosphate phosphatase n=1 Tax=Cytobacillus kochii TaxID=859143 RepID=A0A248TJ51_9BACI|nr:HAD-IIIA family hydrolase [Cytobacillus kochii]ASV68227.1 3-deoxy-D-manno-octulosonate 8-phosphate phosphatase [Cytobacillus kochii]MED1604890.1 HAD-IIIA family hydrolase [Cytobacillus kochii]